MDIDLDYVIIALVWIAIAIVAIALIGGAIYGIIELRNWVSIRHYTQKMEIWATKLKESGVTNICGPTAPK